MAQHHVASIPDLWRPKHAITRDTRIATAGSCFAQHIGRWLKGNGFTVLDGEKRPPGMSGSTGRQYGYELYSCRYGNIYSSRELLQMLREAHGLAQPALPAWERDGRWFDAQRPSVEPDGVGSAEFVVASRERHLQRVAEVYAEAELFIFTLGLTETWEHIETGTVYPTAPGTIAGDFDPDVFRLRNLTYPEVRDDLIAFRELMRQHNPDVRFLFTVSPVPLTATATDHHVLTAATYSKSVLRAVVGELSDSYDDIDYFPSYELVMSPASRGFFFDANLRTVNQAGVDIVMAHFERSLRRAGVRLERPTPRASRPADAEAGAPPSADDVVCEDALLDAFG